MTHFYNKLTKGDWFVALCFIACFIILAVVASGCGSYDSEKENDPNCYWSTQHQSYWCEEEVVEEQKGAPRFVCNNSDNPPPWCDDDNWSEDTPPGQGGTPPGQQP